MTKHAAPPTPPEDPDRDPTPDPTPVDEPVEEREPPLEASSLSEGADPQGETWNPKYRSALDNPRHPLHHLKDA